VQDVELRLRGSADNEGKKSSEERLHGGAW